MEYNSQLMSLEPFPKGEDRTAFSEPGQNKRKEVDRSSHVLPRNGALQTSMEGKEEEALGL